MCVSLHTAFTHPHESRSRKAPCPANPSYAAPRYLGVKRRHFYFLLVRSLLRILHNPVPVLSAGKIL
ncbi:hypothetical protein NDU88_004461 [Pleurodeles waltl]|uniref:Uncharacterized protein n=1 Tax=Pleurodeles waltl TaxID=8319 RepID=A0AAV7M8F6_PLEWA|nr:hypothetical protein NDU88_004461 [Pleurodeles waltl]